MGDGLNLDMFQILSNPDKECVGLSLFVWHAVEAQ